MKNKLKEEIEKILRQMIKDATLLKKTPQIDDKVWLTFKHPNEYTDALLSLFDKTLKELVGEEMQNNAMQGSEIADYIFGFNQQRNDILFKWEGGK